MKQAQSNHETTKNPTRDRKWIRFSSLHPCASFLLFFAGIPLVTLSILATIVFLVVMVLGVIAGWL